MIKMAESMASLVLILVVLTFTFVSGIDDKCAACNAVAEEIEYGLSNEKPRNHLDMRHRLDSKGQRKGKVIDYRVSELRVVELLDGLCDKMQDYTLQKVDLKRYEWVRVDSWDNLTISEYLFTSKKPRHIQKIYHLIVEGEMENVLLAEQIKKGSVKVGGVSKILCQDLSKHCKQSSGSYQADADDDEPDREL
ncbi:unnamed protein product [Dovyalis caffra]|uniref:DUF3456 domain-containing protein n=1 Tax=Dovyalis caffra TaxID=77055 RepID=A0AAV1S567_9ROSI|nr:unnamed protein product [Dovyalis caffra]